jgi:signal transduction histidine kinase
MGGAVNRQVERLSDVIDMVSDASRIARGSFTLKADTCDLHLALTEAYLPLQESLQERAVSIQGGIPQPGMMIANGDLRRLRRIFSSVIDNFIRYCPRGSTFKLLVGISAVGLLEVRFQDSGPGFPESEIALISGADPYRTLFQRAKPGTLGISLLVARATCEFLRGSLTLENSPDGGAIVSIKLPRAA